MSENAPHSELVSSQFGKLYTALMIKQLNERGFVTRMMDVGTGHGGYHDLLKDHVPDMEWVGVEVWEPYVRDFKLHEKYPEMYNEDVRTLDFNKIKKVDLTLFGDILEHMTKEEAQAVMDKTLAMSRLVLVSIPIVHYPQEEFEGNPYQRHVKDDWSHGEFCTSFPGLLTGFVHDHIGVYFLSLDEEASELIKLLHPAVSSLVEQKLPNDQIKWG
ncbi:methyltransferase domain-containing protein [Aestuariispira insulae]|uniref:Methyltransferase type 11 domain-containing protein n=1 Tax=Aestuariispira insulae TaxID=1461337 RepID=A0A3D9H9I9_9PROT|nr:class I SAM-dependent methyltransferase [Aestuariispira insulae]RED46139.1 hypothetical protein DFP90_11048 [Aestuariispira insulae]